MDRRSLTLSRQDLAEDRLGFFRWGRVAGKILVTNDAGDWALLSEAELDELLAGRVAEGHSRFEEFKRMGFLRDGLDLDAFADRVARRNRHVGRGPHLHVVNLRRSGEGTAVDMSPETAAQVAEVALQSTSPSITFELRAGDGEPLASFDVLRHLLDLARSRNMQTAGKTLAFRLVTNLTAMTAESAEWLIANDVRVRTDLDGPAGIHDWNRRWIGGSTHAEVIRWIDYFQRQSVESGQDSRIRAIEARANVTRRTLEEPQGLVDEYVARGLGAIYLRPLNPLGISGDVWSEIGYSAEEYLDFYRRALDYILELNRQGVDIVEGTARIFATRILTSEDPGVCDIQSPAAAGTSELAYDADGRVFPCEEARLIDFTGDPIFAIGDVRTLTLAEVLQHPTVRAIAAASLLDAQPMCADCWNKPFCGIDPVHSFATRGDLFGQRPHSFECKEHMAVSRRLFELLANETDSRTAEILARWATTAPRDISEGIHDAGGPSRS